MPVEPHSKDCHRHLSLPRATEVNPNTTSALHIKAPGFRHTFISAESLSATNLSFSIWVSHVSILKSQVWFGLFFLLTGTCQ